MYMRVHIYARERDKRPKLKRVLLTILRQVPDALAASGDLQCPQFSSKLRTIRMYSLNLSRQVLPFACFKPLTLTFQML